ncbi:MAG: hypothetical protein LCH36_06415 [Actinobacteria bacterium]|nr:hypothetical protein [Actinomycetota bacterium]
MIVAALPGIVMLVSGAACLGGAVAARNRVGIAAAAVMLTAMFDLTVSHFVPALIWALLLASAGVVLGVRLRPVGEPRSSVGARLRNAVMLASAVSYVAMAWLVMTHAHGGPGSAVILSEDLPTHAAHSGGVAAIPAVAIAVLVAVQLALCFMALRRGRRVLAIETGAMAAMLLAMFVPSLFA